MVGSVSSNVSSRLVLIVRMRKRNRRATTLDLIRCGGHLPKGELDVDHGEHEGKTKTRRDFTEDYKSGAVRLVLDEGETVAGAVHDLGLTESSLRN